ncbi:pilus (MSHA type) biogenesis protein MshL [Campylobacter sp. MIT 99-7217]|nr:pilus (MSHA type) biogenesis protein MshL [Campylobacter sp. MIT 99-7217]TQR30613.1 pilus (MSHA type) biogenesis protein MshL [Campylobacter sp. MIT 99-7217]
MFVFLCVLSYAEANSCQKNLFDIQILEEVSLEESLQELALLCTFSIVVKDEKSKQKLSQMQKNIYIKQMSLKEIFDLLLQENNLHYDFNGKVLAISYIKTQSFKLSYITSIREGQSITKASVDTRARQNLASADENLDDNMIKTLEKFDFWETIEKELFELLEQADREEGAKNPIINANAGLITISGTFNQLKLVSSYIKNLQERLKKQVIIDVSIIAVKLNKTHSSGINWQNFNINFSSQATDTNSFINFQSNNNGSFFVKNLGLRAGIDFNSVLNFLSSNGETKVLSNPKLMALNNQQAIISVGDTINYQVKESSKSTDSGTTVSEIYNNYSIFVGILLNILPEISDEDKIMLRINPSLSDFKYVQDNRRQDIPRAIAPDTVQKKLSTVVQVENNQTLILGGLISKNEASDENSIHFLSKIPLFGNLFRGEENSSNTTEIVFIITPLIVSMENSPPSLTDLGFSI